MSLIYSIEISNFINVVNGGTPWKPKWVHQRFDLDGKGAAINIPNGGGKSTICISMLALLAGNKKKLNEIRNIFFAPRSSGTYTHFRVETRVAQGITDDLLGLNGGEYGGNPYVIGMYGNSGEGESLYWYCYPGTLEDCPVANLSGNKIRLTGDNDFKDRLYSSFKGKLFPEQKDSGPKAWQMRMGSMFDMAGINQLLVYQLASGAEGSNGYFNIERLGRRYDEALFYELLAPELLSDPMGAQGENDEHGIEDTIHEKAGGIIRARFSAKKAALALEKDHHALEVMERAFEDGKQYQDDKDKFDGFIADYTQEIASLKNILVDDPMPGVPRRPAASLPSIANMLVLLERDGNHAWHLPDRALAMFTGEDAAKVNQRAERKGIKPESATKSQVIEIACDHGLQGRPQGGGWTGKFYKRDNISALLEVASNFTAEWDREKAMAAINEIFDWAEAHADTNPARLRLIQDFKKEVELSELKVAEEKEVARLVQTHKTLEDSQKNIGAQQAEYKRMQDSKLFSPEELADPKATGSEAQKNRLLSNQALQAHQTALMTNAAVYADWLRMVSEFKIETGFKSIAAQIEDEAQAAIVKAQELGIKIQNERCKDAPLEKQEREQDKLLNELAPTISRIEKLAPLESKYREVFPGLNPDGLEKTIRQNLREAERSHQELSGRNKVISPKLDALKWFRQEFPDSTPAMWVQDRLNKWDSIGVAINTAEIELAEHKNKLSQLDLNPVAAGKVARLVIESAGGASEPLYRALARMDLPTEQNGIALTLFSALLHSPVYPNAVDAEHAAKKLADAGLEAPVFVFDRLAEYCRSGGILSRGEISEGLILGIRTRQVECILDPSLVDREKRAIEGKIETVKEDIVKQTNERALYSPEHANVKRVKDAAEALESNYDSEALNIASQLSKLDAEILPSLRLQESNITCIQAMLEINKLLAGESFESLLLKHKQAAENVQQITAARIELKNIISTLEKSFSSFNDVANQAKIKAGKYVEILRRVHEFSMREDINPEYMKNGDVRTGMLRHECDAAETKAAFQFALAAEFLKQGNQYAIELAKQIQEMSRAIEDGRNKCLQYSNEILSIKDRAAKLTPKIVNIDNFVRDLMKRYRGYGDDVSLADSVTDIQLKGSYGLVYDLREEKLLDHLAGLLEDFIDDIKESEDRALKTDVDNARKAMSRSKERFVGRLNELRQDKDVPEYIKDEIASAQDNPQLLNNFYAASKKTYQDSLLVHEKSRNMIEKEWDEIGESLRQFTVRLPGNFKLMRDIFAPQRDSVTGNYIGGGYEIKAEMSDLSNVREIFQDIVEMIERREHAIEFEDNGDDRKRLKTKLRDEIRRMFYSRVLRDVNVKLCMPSVSSKALTIEPKMVSSGQGVAMTLLWIVKMARFVNERESGKKGMKAALQEYALSAKSQFALIDGAFSHLSDKKLIDEALAGIGDTRGKFQLIITVHDPHYKNDYNHFPVLITGHEIEADRIMYAEHHHGIDRLVEPDAAGSHYGAMELMQHCRETKVVV